MDAESGVKTATGTRGRLFYQFQRMSSCQAHQCHCTTHALPVYRQSYRLPWAAQYKNFTSFSAIIPDWCGTQVILLLREKLRCYSDRPKAFLKNGCDWQGIAEIFA